MLKKGQRVIITSMNDAQKRIYGETGTFVEYYGRFARVFHDKSDNTQGWFRENVIPVPETKVTVDQIREFVRNTEIKKNNPTPERLVGYAQAVNDILDFIEDRPQKPTPEEIIKEDWKQRHGTTVGTTSFVADVIRDSVNALREAGYLKEES